MEKIDSIPGRLFYAVYHMYKDQQIQAKDKIVLKGIKSIQNRFNNY